MCLPIARTDHLLPVDVKSDTSCRLPVHDRLFLSGGRTIGTNGPAGCPVHRYRSAHLAPLRPAVVFAGFSPSSMTWPTFNEHAAVHLTHGYGDPSWLTAW
jgi:hypothetical protein